jgi:hypothetical protein
LFKIEINRGIILFLPVKKIEIMENSVNITVVDRKGEEHLLEGPLDMNMNLMEPSIILHLVGV